MPSDSFAKKKYTDVFKSRGNILGQSALKPCLLLNFLKNEVLSNNKQITLNFEAKKTLSLL